MLPLLGCSLWVMLCRCKVIPLKYWSFVSVAAHISAWHNLFVSYRSSFLHEIGGILWLTLWRCWLHSCRMIILIAEYGLMHRGDCINCETCYFYFDLDFVWARRLSLCLACKPFPGLCVCTRTGQRCLSVVAIRFLSLFTNRADRRSQINSLDSWCATRISKTLDVVHRYALLVSNSK